MKNPDPRGLRRLSKRMSWALRHGALDAHLHMDQYGYVALADLMRYLRQHFPRIEREDVFAVVENQEPEKCRFTIKDDCIRANYGHSLENLILHEEMVPTAVLYHGTCQAALGDIFRDGLMPMGRQYVHLTTDTALALRIGSRHGRAVVLQVDAARALQAGVRFYRANPAFWLASHIPPDCLQQFA